MKTLFTVKFLLIVFINAAGQTMPPSQKAFCQFIAAFNGQNLDAIYDNLCPDFQATVDRAVCTGGLLHVYQTNGTVHSASVEQQSTDQGVYYVLAERGMFKVQLSVDSLHRIDGLRIKQIENNVPMPLASMVFHDRSGQGSATRRND